MRQAGLPGGLDHVRAAFLLCRIALVPPGRAGVGGQARQGGIEHAGLQQAVEEGITQFVVHGGPGQFVGELVEQGGGNRIQLVVAVPPRQLFHQGLLTLVGGGCTQLVKQRRQQARAIAGAGIQL
ncbi:hypothetical protein D9M72_296000 [compost metagenome]